MLQNHYKIEIAMSATISEKVVEEIIRKEVQEQTGRTVQKIHVTYDGTKFTGYQITFTPETTASYKSSKEFIEQKWR